MISKFVHLHLHTKYSLLDGMCKFDGIIENAKKYDMNAVAITDHGNMYGVIDFYDEMVKAGIKPMIGLETYVVNDIKKDISEKVREKNHLVLLVKNTEGYKNLIKLSTYAFTQGFYYKPTIDKNILREHSSGLIAISACIHGEIAAKIINNDEAGAFNAATEYLSIFGEGNFFLESQYHGLEEEIVMNRGLKELSQKTSIPIVATNDVHYLKKEDAKAHDILLCIQTGQTMKAEDRMRFATNEFYFKNYDEMKQALPEQVDAIERTVEVANKCTFELSLNKNKYFMPSYKINENIKDLDEYLAETARTALNKKYKKVDDNYAQRLEHELGIIKKMEYSGYFLIVYDIVNYAKENNIPVGPGRGSAAGSLVAYVLGITDIDPLKYDLLFERFLNPDRVSPPDIDIDFSDEERDKIISYIVNKFGKDRVAQIITFQTLGARQAIRDVGRVLEIPLKAVDELAKKVPEGINVSLADALKDEGFVTFVNQDTARQEIVNNALKIEGLLRQDSTHAAGVVIAPEDLINYVPLAVPKDKDKDDKISDLNYMTQYEMATLEKIGLLKFDILGLRNLSVIKKTLEMIKENTGKEIKIPDDDFSNQEVYKLLSEGNTAGVFQLESSGMRDLLVKIKPTAFEEIIAINSLFRPGPMKMIDDYIRRKKGIEKIKYDMPQLEEILKTTYGIPIYQEQVMQIAVKVAGFTLSEADNLRRAMSKKKADVMETIGEAFIKGAVKNNIDKDAAENLFLKLDQFSQYGFNKSHAAAYAVLAYQTAYLKTLYPVEYMAALLTSVMDKQEKMTFYIQDCAKNNIKVLPPDINKSGVDFKVEMNTIRFGLAAVKNVGLLAARDIVAKRWEKGDYTAIFDFCQKVNLRIVNSKTIESLVKAGAFDCTLSKRAQVFEGIEKAMKTAESLQKNAASGQENLFEVKEDESLSDIPEWAESRLLTFEKEVLGIYISSHPLAKYEKLLKYVAMNIKNLKENRPKNSDVVFIGGVVHDLAKKINQKGEEKMHFFIEDLTDKIKVIASEKLTREKKDIFGDSIMFMIRGKMSFYDEDDPVVYADGIIKLNEAYGMLGKFVHINLLETGNEEIIINEIKAIISRNKGEAKIILHLLTADNKDYTVKLADNSGVKVNEELLQQLGNIVGEENIRLSWK